MTLRRSDGDRERTKQFISTWANFIGHPRLADATLEWNDALRANVGRRRIARGDAFRLCVAYAGPVRLAATRSLSPFPCSVRHRRDPHCRTPSARGRKCRRFCKGSPAPSDGSRGSGTAANPLSLISMPDYCRFFPSVSRFPLVIAFCDFRLFSCFHLFFGSDSGPCCANDRHAGVGDGPAYERKYRECLRKFYGAKPDSAE